MMAITIGVKFWEKFETERLDDDPEDVEAEVFCDELEEELEHKLID